jgi:hypothetical protein
LALELLLVGPVVVLRFQLELKWEEMAKICTLRPEAPSNVEQTQTLVAVTANAAGQLWYQVEQRNLEQAGQSMCSAVPHRLHLLPAELCPSAQLPQAAPGAAVMCR